jgi:hypothetical protein
MDGGSIIDLGCSDRSDVGTTRLKGTVYQRETQETLCEGESLQEMKG